MLISKANLMGFCFVFTVFGCTVSSDLNNQNTTPSSNKKNLYQQEIFHRGKRITKKHVSPNDLARNYYNEKSIPACNIPYNERYSCFYDDDDYLIANPYKILHKRFIASLNQEKQRKSKNHHYEYGAGELYASATCQKGIASSCAIRAITVSLCATDIDIHSLTYNFAFLDAPDMHHEVGLPDSFIKNFNPENFDEFKRFVDETSVHDQKMIDPNKLESCERN